MIASRKGAVGRTAATAALALTASLLIPVSTHAVTGTPDSDNTRGFTARLDIGAGQRGCSGTLVDPSWLLTAASCFVDNPAQGVDVPAGKPPLPTTATIGRTDLTTTAGHVRNVIELVPRTDRDLVLARLSGPVPDVPPVALADTAPSAGETLTAAGYGRTTDEWAPLKLHTGSFATGTPAGNELPVSGQNGVALCPGDTGGPLLRGTGSAAKLVGINSRSFQGGCYGVDETQTSTDGIAVRVDDLGTWLTSEIRRPPIVDFNCDAVEDIAIGAPRSDIAVTREPGGSEITMTNAGAVRVVYGGGAGTVRVHQSRLGVPDLAESGDRFGEALATTDYDQDGCTDLIVGTPFEDVGDKADAGMVSVLYGSRGGLLNPLGRAPTNYVQGAGSGIFATYASEPGDLMGDSLAAGQTAQGAPYLLMGLPGEDVGAAVDAGSAIYVQDGRSGEVHPGLAGAVEAGDRFGKAVAGDANHLAIGIPGEAIGARDDAGMVLVLKHTWRDDGMPTPVAGLTQDTAGVTAGVAEAGDEFGAAVALTGYRPAGAATASHSLLAVGSPGEGLVTSGTNRVDAGFVFTFHFTASGSWNLQGAYSQLPEEIAGIPEAGDRFGEKVDVANTAPAEPSTAASMRLAVGAPGEALNGAAGAGTVQSFSLLGNPGDGDSLISPGTFGLPGTPGAGQHFGIALTATGTQLYLGMPFSPSDSGTVHTMPWSNVTGGAIQPVTTYQPGQNGLPTGDRAFGIAIQ